LPSGPPPSVGEQQSPLLVERRRSPIVLTSPPTKPRPRTAWLIALGLVVAGVCWLAYRLAFPPVPRVTQITRLTNSGHVDPWGGIASDGSRLFFLERDGDHWNNRQISAAGGESAPFDAPFKNTRHSQSPPTSQRSCWSVHFARLQPAPLVHAPCRRRAPPRGRHCGGRRGLLPDGAKVAFTNLRRVHCQSRDGLRGSPTRGFSCLGIDWSPNAADLTFPRRILPLQVHISGKSVPRAVIFIPFLPGWNAFDGHWTSDGSYYIFSAFKDERQTLWGGSRIFLAAMAGTRCPYNSPSLPLPMPLLCPLATGARSTPTVRSLAESTVSPLRSPPPTDLKPVLPELSVEESPILRIASGCSTAMETSYGAVGPTAAIGGDWSEDPAHS